MDQDAKKVYVYNSKIIQLFFLYCTFLVLIKDVKFLKNDSTKINFKFYFYRENELNQNINHLIFLPYF